MTHGEEEAQTKEEKIKEPCPLHDTYQAVHFFFFLYFRGGRRNRRKRHEEDNERAVPQHNTWRRSTNREKSFTAHRITERQMVQEHGIKRG